jgi:hypothetical protein
MRYLYILAFFAVILLDATALMDISGGQEPNLYGEYLMLLASVPLLVYFFQKARFQQEAEKESITKK